MNDDSTALIVQKDHITKEQDRYFGFEDLKSIENLAFSGLKILKTMFT